MTRKAQKRIEWASLERFLYNPKSLLLPSNIEDGHDPPDFVLTFPDKKVSVEHTQFMNSEQKRIEEFRKSIIDLAREKFEEKYGKVLSVQFNFTDKPIKTSKEKDKMFNADILLDLVLSIYEKNRDREFYISTKFNRKENEYIRHIYLNNQREIFPWETVGAFFVQYADLEILQKMINKKSSIISSYKMSVDEKWLLIEAGIGHKSSGYQFKNITNQLDKKLFDKIVFLDYRANEFVEI